MSLTPIQTLACGCIVDSLGQKHPCVRHISVEQAAGPSRPFLCPSCASLQAELSACREQLDEALQSAQREVARLETEAMERQSELVQTKRDLAVSQETVRLLQQPHWCQRAADAEAELERVRQERNEAQAANADWLLDITAEIEERQRVESALAALKAAQAWRPMESAPKDGSAVLAYRDSTIQIVRWKSIDGHKSGGFWDRWGARRSYVEVAPTHWLPLPAAPPEEK